MKLVRYVLVFALPILVLFGCAGAGGGSNITNSALVGVYRTDFTRGVSPNSSLVMLIDDRGRVGAQVNNSTGTEWAGQGTIIGSSVNVSLNAVSSGVTGAVLVQGTIVPGTPPTINVTMSGAFSATSTATQFSGINLTPFARGYAGSYTGGESGTFGMTIDNNGVITGSLTSPSLGTSLPISGQVSLDGSVSFHIVNTANTSFTGFVYLAPGGLAFSASGGWSFSGMTGTWTATPGP